VRATLDVSFLQAQEAGRYPGQNPTTVGRPGYRRRIVKEGETIDWIAYDEYGDSAMWRFVADTNGLDDPGRLTPGQELAIAPPP
jgi:nucleoid-associated protein YgaU